MCGIVGLLAFDDLGKQRFSKMQCATDSLTHRGPDGQGLFQKEFISLGHRRLSIIDTSDLASQPFTDHSGRYTIVFNGEIFNYKALKRSLIDEGIQFRSESDTEVLLQLYINKKEQCLALLDGEFAFVIADNKEQTLFVARDRFGVKPLYYYHDEHAFMFASEMKALIKLGVPKKIDQASLQAYFHLNYIPAPYSIFEKVLKLAAGSYALLTKKGTFTSEKYYTIHSVEKPLFTNYEEATLGLRQRVETSVENRMEADVPLGAFLSGGVDSSIITSIAAKRSTNLNTFSIGYKDEPLFDETHYAELVAKRYKTNHTVFYLGNDDLYESLNQFLDTVDEPFADSSALAVNVLSMYAKKHVSVALSGDGADELFAGYNKHYAEYKMREGGLLVDALEALSPVLKRFPRSRNSRLGNLARQLSKFSEGSTLSSKERYWRWAGFENSRQEDVLLLKSSADYLVRKQALLKEIGKEYNSVLKTDMKLVLENDMLVKVDRMSMKQSLEVRVPFLDAALVDYAFQMPAHFKIDDKGQKKILKDAFKKDLPGELLTRKKQGFEVPLLKWFLTDLKSLIVDDLLEPKFIEAQAVFNPGAIERLKSQLFSKNPDDAVAKVWALIVFQHWWKKYYA